MVNMIVDQSVIITIYRYSYYDGDKPILNNITDETSVTTTLVSYWFHPLSGRFWTEIPPPDSADKGMENRPNKGL